MSPLATHLALNQVALDEIKHFGAPRKGRSAEVLLVIGEKAETTQTIRLVPTPVEYWVCTTFPRERDLSKPIASPRIQPSLRWKCMRNWLRDSRTDSRMCRRFPKSCRVR